MTVHVEVLEARLSQFQSRAQRLANQQLAADSAEMVALWHGLHGLEAEIWRALRQFDDLDKQREALQAQLGGTASDQSAYSHSQSKSHSQSQSRLASFDSDLARLRSRAGLLAASIVQLRQREGQAFTVDLSHDVCLLGTQLGKSLDHTMVRRTVFEASTQPRLAGTAALRADAANSVQALFVVMGMVVALLRGSGSRVH